MNLQVDNFPKDLVRYEIKRGSRDKAGDYTFTKYWYADYTPGHPDGEDVPRIRGQVFHDNPDKHQRQDRERGMTVVEVVVD